MTTTHFLFATHTMKMQVNYETVILGERCVLVPYRAEHVAKYHEWMKDPALLAATASEPLSLKEEYAMQESWRRDEAKCTFIALARELLDAADLDALVSENEACGMTAKNDFIQRSLPAMVGDVNLFLSEEENEDNRGCANNGTAASKASVILPRMQAELDLMVARKDFRGKGVGREAATLMMQFGATKLSIRRFFCKIHESNVASLGLFRTKLGFSQCAYAACFREVELELKVDSSTEMIEKLAVLSGSSSMFICP